MAYKTKQSEKKTEPYLVAKIERLGGQCIKLGQQGWPDRLCVLPGPTIFLVETKSEGQALRPLQRYRAETLIKLGVRTFVADTREAVDAILKELTDR